MIRKGMPADEVLKVKGYEAKRATRPPVKDGENVAWFYPDCVVVMHHKLKRWRVEKVLPR